MDNITEHKNYRLFDSAIHRFSDKLKEVSFPGFEKVPVYDVIKFFINGIQKGSLNIRATAIAFNFLLSLGPGLIFLLAVLPYLPIENFQENLNSILENLIPANSYIAIEPILDEIFMRRGGLPIFGLLVSLFFAQKGIHGITEAFNATFHSIEIRSWYRQRFVSIGLVFIFYGLVIIASAVFFLSRDYINPLLFPDKSRFADFLFLGGKWVLLVTVTFFCISFLYYFGPSRKTKWKFFSTGSTLATILSIVASLGFTYFMNHFAQLNKFFGSIGAFIALMLWMNFNAITLLIGFELNASINNAHMRNAESVLK